MRRRVAQLTRDVSGLTYAKQLSNFQPLHSVQRTADQTATQLGATAEQIRLTTRQVNRLITNLDSLVTTKLSLLTTALNNITKTSEQLRVTVNNLTYAQPRQPGRTDPELRDPVGKCSPGVG